MIQRPALLLVLIALLAGLGAGLYLGWVAMPGPDTAADPSSLHPAFKDDYVLMIAAAYAGDGDLSAAKMQLASLGFVDPAAAVAAAPDRLSTAGLPAADQDRLARLAAALTVSSSP